MLNEACVKFEQMLKASERLSNILKKSLTEIQTHKLLKRRLICVFGFCFRTLEVIFVSDLYFPRQKNGNGATDLTQAGH